MSSSSSHGIEKSELQEQVGRCVESDETLRSHLRARIAQLEDVIAAAIAKNIGAPEDDLRPHVVAASLTAAFIVLSERGAGSSPKPKSADDVRRRSIRSSRSCAAASRRSSNPARHQGGEA